MMLAIQVFSTGHDHYVDAAYHNRYILGDRAGFCGGLSDRA